MRPSASLSPMLVSRGTQSDPGLLPVVPGVVHSVADASALPLPTVPLIPTTLPTLTVPLPDHHSLTLQAPPVVTTVLSDVASAASKGSSIISHAVSEGESVVKSLPGSPLVPSTLPTITVPLPDHSLTLQAPPVISTVLSGVDSAVSKGSSLISHVVSTGVSVVKSVASPLASDLSKALPSDSPLTHLTPSPSLPLPISLPSPSSLSLLTHSLPTPPLPIPPFSTSLPPSLPLSLFSPHPSANPTALSLTSNVLPPIISTQDSTEPTLTPMTMTHVPVSSRPPPSAPTSRPSNSMSIPIPSSNSHLPATLPSMGPSSQNPSTTMSPTLSGPSIPSGKVPSSSLSSEPNFPTIVPGSTSGILAHSSDNNPTDPSMALSTSLWQSESTWGSMIITTLNSTAFASTSTLASISGSNHASPTGPKGTQGPNGNTTPTVASTQNGSANNVSTGFLQHPAKVAGVFTAVGVVVIAGAAAGFLILSRLRRGPRRGSHRVPSFDPDEERQEERNGSMQEQNFQTSTRRSGIDGQSPQPSFDDFQPEDPFATMPNPLISNYQALDTSETARSSRNMIPTSGAPTSPVDPVDPYGWPVTKRDQDSPRPAVSPDPYSVDPDVRAAVGWILADEPMLGSIPEDEDEDSLLTMGYGTRPVTTATGSQATRMQP